MFKDRPLLGFGFGQYPHEKLSYLSDRSSSLNLEAIRERVSHNTLLTLLVETGIIGLGLYLALLFTWCRDGVRIWLNPSTPPWARRQAVIFVASLCVYFFQLLFHEVTYKPDDNVVVFLLAGINAALRTADSPETTSPRIYRQSLETPVSPQFDGA
jgi:O-antigen ligase